MQINRRQIPIIYGAIAMTILMSIAEGLEHYANWSTTSRIVGSYFAGLTAFFIVEFWVRRSMSIEALKQSDQKNDPRDQPTAEISINSKPSSRLAQILYEFIYGSIVGLGSGIVFGIVIIAGISVLSRIILYSGAIQ